MAESDGPAGRWLRHLRANPVKAAQLADLSVDSGSATALAGRVTRSERGGGEVITETGTIMVMGADHLCTGDWVLLEPTDDPPRVIGRVERSTQIIRHSADKSGSQVLAADTDEVWLVVPGDSPIPVGRMERSLVLAWDSGAQPVVIMTKIDLVDQVDQDTRRQELEDLAQGAEVHLVSSVSGEGLSQLRSRLAQGTTVALLGSSGAGKSSLINLLAGEEVAEVAEVRAQDQKGRHTTAWRHLVLLSNSAAVIDTPGLRAVGIWVDSGGVDATFPDVAALLGQCRFRDCSHNSEPGCAVLEAVEQGTLSADRLGRYLKLQAEAAWAESQVDHQAARARRQHWAQLSKESRSSPKRR